nr:leucyl/phenylalanyl-tRNA--protein transferase [Nannocystis sp. SCPEA4]
MPVFALTDELVFPDPSQAEPDGLLALGGDLRPERLLLAYAHGIFPWSSEDEPLLWWSPAPRAVLVPGAIEVPRSLAKAIRRRPYRITLDLAFEAVIAACAETPRPGQDRTWITPGIRAAFTDLHRRGLVHSVEAWDGELLVGGLYGLAIGSVFCGESMFARADDASKIAFVALAEQLRRWEFSLIDCQVETAHLRRFGAAPVERAEFMRRLTEGVARPWRVGVWRLDEDLAGRKDGGPPPREAPPPVMWRMSRETGDASEGARGERPPGRRKRRGSTARLQAAVPIGADQMAGEAARGAGAAAEVGDMAQGTGEGTGTDEQARGTGEAPGVGDMARGTGEQTNAGAGAGAAEVDAAGLETLRPPGEDLARGTGEVPDGGGAPGAGAGRAAGEGPGGEGDAVA